MKHLPVIVWHLVYAFIFGAVVTQGVFYLYEREATGLLYVLSLRQYCNKINTLRVTIDFTSYQTPNKLVTESAQSAVFSTQPF